MEREVQSITPPPPSTEEPAEEQVEPQDDGGKMCSVCCEEMIFSFVSSYEDVKFVIEMWSE